MKEWGRTNRERKNKLHREWIKQNRQRSNLYRNRWRKEHIEYAQFLARRDAHIRRSLERKAEGSYTRGEWLDLLQQFDYTCANPVCGHKHTETRWGKLTVDHIVPLILGGANSIDNIQPLCYRCNYSKNNKVYDYRQEFFNARLAA